jgi:hypothetical protein
VFVNKNYVDFVKQIPSVAGTPAKPQAAEQTTVTETPTAPVAGAPTTQPSDAAQLAAAPTTQPSGAEVEFDKLEAAFNEATAKTIDQQPLNEMLASYEKLRADAKLPASLSRVADGRIAVLKVRIEARDQFLAVQKQQNEMRAKQQALKAEQEEIAQQIKDKEVRIYTAVGMLRTSSIQQGGQMTYRLTDPANGRTVCYLRSDDPKYGTLLGQFIGVKGELTSDPALNLRVVKPTEWSAVDPNTVFRGVGAQIVPPSLLPQAQEQASVQQEK